jgi:hypothetical protein
LLDEVVACLDHNVIFVAKDGGDLVRDPLLHQVNVDLFDIDLLVKLRWELGRLEALLINAERHRDGLIRLLVVVWCFNDVSMDAERKLAEVAGESSQLAARWIRGHLRSYVNMWHVHGPLISRQGDRNHTATTTAKTSFVVLSCPIPCD